MAPSPETGAGVRSRDLLMNVGGTKGNKRYDREKDLVRECDKKQKASNVNMNQRHMYCTTNKHIHNFLLC